jgi:DNA ligase 1
MPNRIMKGEQCDDLSIVKLPVLVQPKFDGIRVCKQNGVALSGQLKPIANERLAHLIEHNCPDNIDGEIWWPGVKFEEITSFVRTERRAIPDEFRIQVFDLIDNKLTAKERNDKLFLLNDLPDFCERVATMECSLLGQVEFYEREMLALGHEGIMLRYANGAYKYGRSTLKEQCLMKRKPFVDDEALVIDFIEKEHNDNPLHYNERGLAYRSSSQEGKRLANTTGALRVQHPKFGCFNIGTGFTDKQRKEIWNNREKYLHKLVTFKYQVNHVKDAPCPAVFKSFRT